MTSISRSWIALLVASLLAWAPRAAAQERAPVSPPSAPGAVPPAPPGPALDAVAPDGDAQRIAFIVRALDEGRGEAELWWQAWAVTYAGLVAVQSIGIGIAPALYPDRAEMKRFRLSTLLGVVTSFIGLSSLALMPPKAIDGADAFRDLPEETPEQREAKRLAAEAALEAVAREQSFGGGRGWFMHTAGFLINAASGLATWLWLDQPEMGAVKFGVGMALVETQAWTRSTHGMDSLESYRARYGGTVARTAPLQWQFTAHPGGVGVLFSFR